MGLILITAIIGLGSAVAVTWRDGPFGQLFEKGRYLPNWGWVVSGFVWLFVGALIGYGVVAVATTGAYELGSERMSLGNEQLIVMKDGTSLRGSFFFGTGAIGDEQRYSFYVRRADGIRLESWPAEHASIMEVARGREAKVEWIGYPADGPRWWRFGFGERVTDAVFEVPKGSISAGVVLDAE